MLACLLAPIATFTYIYQPEIKSSALFLSNNLFVDLENAALHSTQSAWYDEFVITLPYVSIIWLTVVLLLSSKLLTELYQIKRLSQVGTVQPSDRLQQRFEQLIEKVGASKNPYFCCVGDEHTKDGDDQAEMMTFMHFCQYRAQAHQHLVVHKNNDDHKGGVDGGCAEQVGIFFCEQTFSAPGQYDEQIL